MKNSFTFTCVGIPRTQGSKDQFGREANPYIKPWRADMKYACQRAKPDDWPTTGSFGISVVFTFKRPKKHYTTKGELREDAPYYCVARKGDLDKLCRGLLDALTAVAYDDDDQVVSITAKKRYCAEGEDPGALITVISLPA